MDEDDDGGNFAVKGIETQQKRCNYRKTCVKHQNVDSRANISTGIRMSMSMTQPELNANMMDPWNPTLLYIKYIHRFHISIVYLPKEKPR